MVQKKLQNRSYYVCIAFMLIASHQALHALRINLLDPYDTLIRPSYNDDHAYQMTAWVEGAWKRRVFSDHGTSSNALHIFNTTQNTLAMLDGFAPTSRIGQLRNTVDATDDGVRGHVDICGELDLKGSLVAGGRYTFTDNWSISAYVPAYFMRLHNVSIRDLTENITPADIRVKTLITNNLSSLVYALGDGLLLEGWQRYGIGDIRTCVEWHGNFKQEKPFLRNVLIFGLLGISWPTGLRADENKLCAYAFGNDGAVGIPFIIGMDVEFCHYFHAGADVELMHVFGGTRTRRIKTAREQTNLLLLAKTSVYEDFGLNQRFNMYFACTNIAEFLSCKVGYQYRKHGDDEMALSTNAFSYEIANTNPILDYSTMHQIELSATCTTQTWLATYCDVQPEMTIFARLPFNGKRAIAYDTIGISFTVDF